MEKAEVILSVSNNKVKETAKLQQKKYRNEKGLFLLEGYKPIFEAFCSGVDIETLYTTEKYLEKFDFLKSKVILVSDAVLEKISTTDSMPEAVAVAKQMNYSFDKIKNKKRILLIENVKDAGNLGTLIRCACAFSYDGIVLCGETVDIYNPKVVRSTVGAMFKLPLLKASMHKVREIYSESTFIASVVNHKEVVNPQKIDYKKPFVLMLGSEADGLSEEAISLADIKTTIPISNATESLNLSMAGAILLYISAQ